MTRKQQRLYAIILVLLGVAVAVGLSLSGLRENVTFFYTPSEVLEKVAIGKLPARPFRLGGLVVYGTLEREGKSVRFIVTDNESDIDVRYEGIVPDLFGEGRGVIVTGMMGDDYIFRATEILAKHDENYMPPEVARALKEKTPHGGPYGGPGDDKLPPEYP